MSDLSVARRARSPLRHVHHFEGSFSAKIRRGTAALITCVTTSAMILVATPAPAAEPPRQARSNEKRGSRRPTTTSPGAVAALPEAVHVAVLSQDEELQQVIVDDLADCRIRR
jgi:hypothetical protein